MTQHLVWVWLQWWTHSVFRITACWNQKGSKEGCWGTQGMGGGVRMQFWIFVSVDSSEKLRYKWTWPVITVSWKPTFKSTKEKLKGRVTKSSTASGVQLLRMRWWSEGHLQRRGNDLELETHFQMHLPLRDLGALCSCCWVASVNSEKKTEIPIEWSCSGNLTCWRSVVKPVPLILPHLWQGIVLLISCWIAQKQEARDGDITKKLAECKLTEKIMCLVPNCQTCFCLLGKGCPFLGQADPFLFSTLRIFLLERAKSSQRIKGVGGRRYETYWKI